MVDIRRTVDTFAHDVRSLGGGAAIVAESSWVIALACGAAIVLLAGGAFHALVRTLATRSVVLRCPASGLLTVVQGVTDPDGFITAVVRCGAHPGCRRLSCGTPCVTGGAGGLAAEDSPMDLLRG